MGVRPVTREQAEVAAAVIQWLGTDVGLGFVLECERKIRAARERSGRPKGETDALIAELFNEAPPPSRYRRRIAG